MKKIVISLIVVLTAVSSFAQTETSINSLTATTSFVQNQANADSTASPDNIVVYRLFPTQNRWTFIKLNTRTGQMWQLQYSTEGDDYQFETYLNLTPLISKEAETNGRFMLYSTQNIWTFILLDQIDGRAWQVQWHTDAENRFIERIN